MNNTDRKGGHILPVDGGRHVYGVDHGVCFSPVPKLRTVLWGWRGTPFAPDELEGLERVREALDGDLADCSPAAVAGSRSGHGPADGRAAGERAVPLPVAGLAGDPVAAVLRPRRERPRSKCGRLHRWP